MADFVVYITGYLDAYDEDHVAVTIYNISIHNLITLKTYEIKKRYSDFLSLHTNLLKTYPELQKFHFPRKTLLNSSSDFVKNYRKEAFNYYLQVSYCNLI